MITVIDLSLYARHYTKHISSALETDVTPVTILYKFGVGADTGSERFRNLLGVTQLIMRNQEFLPRQPDSRVRAVHLCLLSE